MIEISKDEKFIQVHDCFAELKECKAGRFTELRKFLLYKLLYLFKNFCEHGELNTHKKGTYHFYFIQKEFADEVGVDKKTVWSAMQWLQREGYITYFSTSKPKYIWKASYVTMNEKFINSKIGNEDKTVFPPDKEEKIDNNFIPTDNEADKEEQLPIIESIGQLPISNIPTVTHEKVNQETEEHKQEKDIERKEELPIIETIDEQIFNEINIIDIGIVPPPLPFSIEAKRITPKKKVKQEKTNNREKITSDENKITGRPQKRIKFGKEKLISYLSNDELVPFAHFSNMGYSSKKRPEYKTLVGYIWQWCMTSESSNNKGYATHIYQTLSGICRDNKEEYNLYIDRINAKAKLNNYNLELQKL